MFQTIPLFIIRSFSLYTSNGICAESLRAASCQQTCMMTHTIAVCTVKNFWWWTVELSETCRVLFKKYIWEISATSSFYYKNLSRYMVTWMSKMVKVSTCPPWRYAEGPDVQRQPFLTSTPDGGERSTSSLGYFYRRYPLNRRLGGFQSQSGHFGDRTHAPTRDRSTVPKMSIL